MISSHKSLVASVDQAFLVFLPHRLIATPATLLHVEVKGGGTNAKLEVREPSCTDVDHPRHHSRHQANQEHTHPSWKEQ